MPLARFVEYFNQVTFDDHSSGSADSTTAEKVIVLASNGFTIDGERVDWATLDYVGGKYTALIEMGGYNMFQIPPDQLNDFGKFLEHFPVLHINKVTPEGLRDLYNKMEKCVYNLKEFA